MIRSGPRFTRPRRLLQFADIGAVDLLERERLVPPGSAARPRHSGAPAAAAIQGSIGKICFKRVPFTSYGLRFAAPRAKLRREMAFTPNQRVRLNLAGLMIEGVTFHAAVTDALATIIKRASEDPPAYRVELLFSFKGLKQIEVPEERIRLA